MKSSNLSPQAKIRPLPADEYPDGSDRRAPPTAAPHGNKRSTALSAIRPIPRRGLSRLEAAMYIGVSAAKFDELVHDGRMPGPKRIDGRKVWDVHALDLAFDSLPDHNDKPQTNSFDDAWGPR